VLLLNAQPTRYGMKAMRLALACYIVALEPYSRQKRKGTNAC
jgi:hypothetical protein